VNNAVLEYDPEQNVWRNCGGSCNSMPTARYLAASAAVDGKVFVMGGVDSSFNALTTVEQYDPHLNVWTSCGGPGCAGLPQKRELEYMAGKLGSIEINGTFYRTQKPATFAKWRDETPEGFVFALKGPRYTTNRSALGEAGAKVILDHVLMIVDGTDIQVGKPLLKGAKVSATVQAQGKGDKVRSIKKRRRKHYRKTIGHRQRYTELAIGGILVAISAKHALPVYAIGVGEGIDDLQPFDAGEFAQAIAGS